MDICMNGNFKYIAILTDSKCCIFNNDMKYHCKFEYYYHIVQTILILCNFLKQYNKIVRIFEIPAHIRITGNELADYWAKHGLKMVKFKDSDGIIKKNYVPLIIQNEINNKRLKKCLKRKEKKKE